MTAEDLITRREWEDIVHSVIDLEQDPKEHCRKINHKGNIYVFTVYPKNKVEIWKKYGCIGGFLDCDVKRPTLYDGRERWSGSTIHAYPTENDNGYDELCERINRYLKHNGDYTEDTIKQLSLF